MSYPVSVAVEPQLTNRDRLTTGFRLILAIPHLILVGGPAFQLSAGFHHEPGVIGGSNGILGAAAVVLAMISWFTILFLGEHMPAIRSFTTYYMRWHARVIAYFMLLEDRYPPFGDGPYPVMLTVAEPTASRDRLTVGLRLLLAIPHFLVLFFVMIAWWIVTVIAWFAILITGEYPAAFSSFSVGVMRWLLRVEAYVLLLVDEYPPFSLE